MKIVLGIGMGPSFDEVIIIYVVAFIATIILSLLIGTFLYKRKLKKNKQTNEEKAKLIIKEAELQAENIKKDKIIEAKEKLF
jgi:ribonuclease Y